MCKIVIPNFGCEASIRRTKELRELKRGLTRSLAPQNWFSLWSVVGLALGIMGSWLGGWLAPVNVLQS